MAEKETMCNQICHHYCCCQTDALLIGLLKKNCTFELIKQKHTPLCASVRLFIDRLACCSFFGRFVMQDYDQVS